MYARVDHARGGADGRSRSSSLPLAPDNDPDRWIRLFDIDVAETEADLRLWKAAATGGLEIDVVDADELVMAASAQAPEPAFNHALGMRTVPELLPSTARLLPRTRRRRGASGSSGAPWSGAEPREQIAVLGADAADLAVRDEPLPDGVSLRWLGPDEAHVWATVVVPVFRDAGFDVGVWERLLPAP